jgi:hypothetical protein
MISTENTFELVSTLQRLPSWVEWITHLDQPELRALLGVQPWITIRQSKIVDQLVFGNFSSVIDRTSIAKENPDRSKSFSGRNDHASGNRSSEATARRGGDRAQCSR